MKTAQKVTRIDRARASEYLWNETEGLVFSAHFVKKDGSLRHMVARRYVKKGLAGGSLPYDPKPRGLLPVFDMAVQDRRMVNLLTLISFNIHGETFIVV